ncbi:MAG TPA: hypothetical protein DDZ88_23830, partial [Verrucomicrobiales bacterium]|nr:hypothetical protein [Verrucomicrobiales bacterium]
MKTLRRHRLFLGWFMTLIMVIAQPATSLRGATFLWAPHDGNLPDSEGKTYGSTLEGGNWNTFATNWHDVDGFFDPNMPDMEFAQGWDNFGQHTAVFGYNGSGPSSVFIDEPINLGGLVFDASGVTLTASSEIGTLTFEGLTPTITIKGYSTGGSDIEANITTGLGGTNGLRIEFDDMSGFLGSNRAVLNLGTAGANYETTLTGGITVGQQVTLGVQVNSTDLTLDPFEFGDVIKNPLGSNQVTLENGAALNINGVNATSQGLSGRVFATNGTGNSSRVDFSGTAISTQVNQNLENLNTIPAATGAQWIGQVNVGGQGGAYTFFASADDGARIFIDGVLVLNNDGGKGNTDLSSAPIFLAAGWHDIRIDYVNGSGGGNINLGYAGPLTNHVRVPITVSNLRQAELNELGGASSALQLLNDVHLTGDALINLSGDTSVQMGRLLLDTGTTLSASTSGLLGEAIVGNGNGFGRTLRFGGSVLEPTIFGDSVNGAGTVTIASDINVAFDGVVSDEGRAMTIQKTGAGWLSFNQTASQNLLGATTQIEMVGSSVTQTASLSSYDSINRNTTLSTGSTAGLSLGMTVSGAGIPNGAVVIAMDGFGFTISGNASTVAANTSLTFSKNPTLVLTGSTAAGAFNPIGSAEIVLAGGNLVLDSKGATFAGIGPSFDNKVTVTENAVIQSVVNAALTTLGSSSNGIDIAANKVLVLDAIAGGRPVADPGANLVIAGNITGDATTELIIRSTQKNAGTTITALIAQEQSLLQQVGFASQSGVVTLTGNNAGFLGTLSFEAGSNLRVEGVAALSNKTFTMQGGTLQLLDDGDGTGSNTETFNFNHNITVTGNSTLAVGRTATSQAPYFTQAANKTAQINDLTIGRNTLTVTNNNNYGLMVGGTTTLTGAPIFTVSAASTSNQQPGLHLSGQVTGNNSILKNGAGTLMLSNASNDFGGAMSFTAFGAGTLLTTENQGLVVGQRLTGSNIAGGTIINAVGVQNIAATGAAGATFTVPNGGVFRVGDYVTGAGVPAGTTVTNITDNVITLSQSVSTANPTLVLTQITLNTAVTGAVSTVNTTAMINVSAGVLAFTDDAALGHASNQVLVNTNSATVGLRVDGTTSSTRTFFLNQANNSLEVTGVNTFTMNSAFNIPDASRNLNKNNTGTLVLTQAQSGWNGNLTVGQGVVRITNAAALGNAGSLNLGTNAVTGATLIANVGAALELVGGITVAETLVFTPGNNNTSTGINDGGALRSVSGNNTWSGTISFSAQTTADSQSKGALISVDSGSTLNISGVMTGRVGTANSGRDSWFAFGGEGAGTISTAMQVNGNLANGVFSIVKVGEGTWNLTAANVFPGQNVYVHEGMLVLHGAGTFGIPGTGGGAGTVFMTPGGSIRLDNTGTNTINRLSNRLLNFYGGEFSILGSSSATTTETTTGTLTFNTGHTIISLTAGTGQQLNFTTGAVTRAAGSTVLFRGSNLGATAGANTATIQATGAGYVFIGQAGVAGALNKGILPYAIIASTPSGLGASFATADTVTGQLRALDASEMSTTLTNNLNGVATAINVSLSSDQGIGASLLGNTMTINSLTLNSGGGVTMTTGQTLVLDSGGLLAFSGNVNIEGGRLMTTSNREMIVHSVGHLTINSALATFSGGLTKAGAGMLTLGSQNFYNGVTRVNEGTLRLAGGTSTIFWNNALFMSGGELDLNGGSQVFNTIRTEYTQARNALYIPDTGGVIMNSSVTQATLGVVTAGVNFAGSISGNIAVVRSTAANGTADWNLYSDNDYTGATIINGGRVQLLGEGALSGTFSIEI